jgi:hypothetical protein
MRCLTANKCVIGETYYLTGLVYRYNFETGEHKPLINQPVKYLGRNTKVTNQHKNWFDMSGQYEFELNDGHMVRMYAKDDVFIEPIPNPEILQEI